MLRQGYCQWPSSAGSASGKICKPCKGLNDCKSSTNLGSSAADNDSGSAPYICWILNSHHAPMVASFDGAVPILTKVGFHLLPLCFRQGMLSPVRLTT